MSGDIITIAFEPELGLSSLHKSVSEHLQCHSSQIHLFSLSEEKMEEEREWFPLDDEVVGVLIKDPLIEIECIYIERFGKYMTHENYLRYQFRIKIFDKIYSKSLFYCPKQNIICPISAFRILNPPSRGYLRALINKMELSRSVSGLENKSNKKYETFREFVKFMKVPESLIDSVTDLINRLWLKIPFENHLISKSLLNTSVTISSM